MVAMRLQDAQEATILGEDRQFHDALRQYPAICRLRELDRASQETVDLLEQPYIPRMCEAHADWNKVPIRQAMQQPVERQRGQFRKLPPRYVKGAHRLKSYDCLGFVARDLKANFVV